MYTSQVLGLPGFRASYSDYHMPLVFPTGTCPAGLGQGQQTKTLKSTYTCALRGSTAQHLPVPPHPMAALNLSAHGTVQE